MVDAKKKKTAAPKTASKKKSATKEKVAKENTVVKATPAKEVQSKMSTKEAAPIFGKGKSIYATGKRKRAITRLRVFLSGEGKIQINKRPLKEYFKSPSLCELAMMPLEMTNNLKSFDINITAHGGGISAQAQAIRHGLARALVVIDKELKKPLKKATLLTRDARIKERKKYGLHRARRGPQFSKR